MNDPFRNPPEAEIASLRDELEALRCEVAKLRGSAPTRWVYMVMRCNGAPIEDISANLNEFASDYWEPCTSGDSMIVLRRRAG